MHLYMHILTNTTYIYIYINISLKTKENIYICKGK